MFDRSSGVLMHITSLPSPHGIGSLGKEAFDFVDFLADAGQRYWQVLPLGHTGYGDSPYQCYSAAAGSPYLIDLDFLVRDGLLTADEVAVADASMPPDATPDRIDFAWLSAARLPLLRRAAARGAVSLQTQLERFRAAHADWLPDYALFMALKDHFGGRALWAWDDPSIVERRPEALTAYRALLADDIAFYTFLQFLFFAQWDALRRYANKKGLRIIGDLPIYVAPDSADVWTNPTLFALHPDRSPRLVAGVPPDYFSATGQLWGNPVYDWSAHERTDYAWWIWRIRNNMALFDIMRLDHFRGFDAFWAVEAGEKTAENGVWQDGPGMKLFRALHDALGDVPFIAEDLGVQTAPMRALLAECGFPGMRVLTFGFDEESDSEHLPHNYPPHSIVYTSTHDSPTICAQIMDESTDAQRHFAYRYLRSSMSEALGWSAIKSVFASPARIAMTTMQDLLSLGADARMNLPATVGGNWRWRVRRDAINPQVASMLHEITATYKRDAKKSDLHYTHAIFDLDGTLLNTIGDLTDAVNFALSKRGHPLRTAEEVLQFVGNGIGKLIERALPSGHADECADCLADFRTYYNAHMTVRTAPYDGIPALLDALKARGMTLGVLSNKYDPASRALVHHYFGQSCFSDIRGERDGVPRKPDPTAVHAMLTGWGADAAHTLYIGDSGVDMQTAKNAGLFAVGVTWGFRSREVLLENGADVLIDTPMALLDEL